MGGFPSTRTPQEGAGTYLARHFAGIVSVYGSDPERRITEHFDEDASETEHHDMSPLRIALPPHYSLGTLPGFDVFLDSNAI